MQRHIVEQKELADLAAAVGARVPAAVLAPLAVYLEQLCRWNDAMNLVGPRCWQDVLTRLVVDSFHLAGFLDGLALPASPLCWDLGSGAGLPGIPLRMVWTRGVYHMVEAREKRALFISDVLARLRLPGTHVFRGAAERFFQEQERPADCIVSRAFMPWRRLLDFVRDHVRPGGVLVVLALESAPRDLPAPWRLARQQAYMAAGTERRFWALTPGGA